MLAYFITRADERVCLAIALVEREPVRTIPNVICYKYQEADIEAI